MLFMLVLNYPVHIIILISSHAGLTDGSVCVCGSGLTESPVPESNCYEPCTGDWSQLCGAAQYMNVYTVSAVPLSGLTIANPGRGMV